MRGQRIDSSWSYYAVINLRKTPFMQWWFGLTYTQTVSGGLRLGGAANEEYVEGGEDIFDETMQGGLNLGGSASLWGTQTITVDGGLVCGQTAEFNCRYVYTNSGRCWQTWDNWDSQWESLTDYNNSAYLNYSRDGGDAVFTSDNKSNNQIEQARSELYTWAEIFGVPENSRITNLEIISVTRKLVTFDNCSTYYYGPFFFTSTGSQAIGVTLKNVTSVDGDWVTVTGWTSTDPTGRNQLATTQFRFALYNWVTTLQIDPTAIEFRWGSVSMLADYSILHGGLSSSGEARITGTTNVSVGGGTSLGGSADVTFGRTYFEEMLGGLILDGYTDPSKVSIETALGGIVASGDAVRYYNYTQVGSGGVLAMGISHSHAPIIGRPNEDTNKGLYWSPVQPYEYWTRLNDETDDNSVSISLPLNVSDTLEVGFGGNTLPAMWNSVVYRMSLSPLMQMQVALYQGNTKIAPMFSYWTNTGGGLVTYTKTLSPLNLMAITDPSDLRLRFIATGKALSLQSAYVHWCKILLTSTEMADINCTYTPTPQGGMVLDGAGRLSTIPGMLLGGEAEVLDRWRWGMGLSPYYYGLIDLQSRWDCETETEAGMDTSVEVKDRFTFLPSLWP